MTPKCSAAAAFACQHQQHVLQIISHMPHLPLAGDRGATTSQVVMHLAPLANFWPEHVQSNQQNVRPVRGNTKEPSLSSTV